MLEHLRRKLVPEDVAVPEVKADLSTRLSCDDLIISGSCSISGGSWAADEKGGGENAVARHQEEDAGSRGTAQEQGEVALLRQVEGLNRLLAAQEVERKADAIEARTLRSSFEILERDLRSERKICAELRHELQELNLAATLAADPPPAYACLQSEVAAAKADARRLRHHIDFAFKDAARLRAEVDAASCRANEAQQQAVTLAETLQGLLVASRMVPFVRRDAVRLMGRLGGGGGGDAYEATCPSLKASRGICIAPPPLYVYKDVRPSPQAGASAALVEVARLYAAQGKGVIRLEAAVVDEHGVVVGVLMERGEQTLYNLLCSATPSLGGPGLPREVGRQVLQDLREAIRELHARGLILCDLKPDNIVLSKSLQDGLHLRLIDLGGASLRRVPADLGDSFTTPGCATTGYASPGLEAWLQGQAGAPRISTDDDFFSFEAIRRNIEAAMWASPFPLHPIWVS